MSMKQHNVFTLYISVEIGSCVVNGIRLQFQVFDVQNIPAEAYQNEANLHLVSAIKGLMFCLWCSITAMIPNTNH